MENILKFLLQVGKLKKIKRTGWILRDVKNPESVAEHSFRLAIMAWVFGQKKNLNLEKLIKMALIHDLVEVLAGDSTPYDDLILKNPHKRKKILKNWPRRSPEEAQNIAKTKLAREKKALEILTANLKEALKNELRNLWIEYEFDSSKKGKFLCQADKVENFLQAMEYAQEIKNFPIEPLGYQIMESVDDPDLLKLLEQMSKIVIQKKHANAISFTRAPL